MSDTIVTRKSYFYFGHGGEMFESDEQRGKQYRYTWAHTESGKSGIHTAYFAGPAALESTLKFWNRDSRWHYEVQA